MGCEVEKTVNIYPQSYACKRPLGACSSSAIGYVPLWTLTVARVSVVELALTSSKHKIHGKRLLTFLSLTANNLFTQLMTKTVLRTNRASAYAAHTGNQIQGNENNYTKPLTMVAKTCSHLLAGSHGIGVKGFSVSGLLKGIRRWWWRRRAVSFRVSRRPRRQKSPGFLEREQHAVVSSAQVLFSEAPWHGEKDQKQESRRVEIKMKWNVSSDWISKWLWREARLRINHPAGSIICVMVHYPR